MEQPSEVCRRWCRRLFTGSSGIQRVQKMQEICQDKIQQRFSANKCTKLPHLNTAPAEKCSRVSCTQGDSRIEGFALHGQLIGNVLQTFSDGSRALYFCKEGVRHGLYLRQGPDGEMQALGLYINGSKEGYWWEILPNKAGTFVREYPSSHHVEVDLQGCFLYPDMETILCGSFTHENKIVSCVRGQLIGLEQDSESLILIPIHKEVSSDAFTCEESRSSESISPKPLQRDPYEEGHVYVKQSQISGAGEGLFALKAIPEGQIVAYFNGVRTKKQDLQESSEYSIVLDHAQGEMLDIPPEFRATEDYRATLGHKVCHSFSPNAAYGYAFHPRFGHIRSVISLRLIEKDEEILCNYKYSLSKSPLWYQKSLADFLRLHVDLDEQQLQKWAQHEQLKAFTLLS